MNIQKFVAYLNKLKGWHIERAYYSDIIQWRDWWRGNYAPFHTVKEMALKGGTVKRPMYRLRMPKRACEDWASLLLTPPRPGGCWERTPTRPAAFWGRWTSGPTPTPWWSWLSGRAPGPLS